MDVLRLQLAVLQQQVHDLQAQLNGRPPPASPSRSPLTPVPTDSPSGGRADGSNAPSSSDAVLAGSGSDDCAGDTSSWSTGAFFFGVVVVLFLMAGGAGLFLHRRALRAARTASASGGHPEYMAAGSVVQNAAYTIDRGGVGTNEPGAAAQIPYPNTPPDEGAASEA